MYKLGNFFYKKTQSPKMTSKALYQLLIRNYEQFVKLKFELARV